MCVVSMVGDHYQDWWKDLKPHIQKGYQYFPQEVSKAEFEALKKEVEQMKELLRRAKIYDEKNNEPNCEIEDKMKFLKEVARLVGIDLDEVLNKKNLL